MKKHLFLYFLLFFMAAAHAQEKDWQWIKRGGAGIEGTEVERVYDIATDSDRNVYVVSPIGVYDLDVDGHPETFYGNPGGAQGDYVLASFACDGSYRWSKVIGGEGNEAPPYIEVDADDNLYVAGLFRTCDADEPGDYPARIGNDIILDQSETNCSLMFLAKYDQNGNLLWFKQPTPSTTDDIAYGSATSVNLAFDNETLYWLVFLTPGTYADGAFVNTMDGANWFVFEYNPNGNFLSATYVDIQTSMGSTALSLKMYHNPYNGYFYFTGNRYTNDTAVVGGETVTGGLYMACFDSGGVFQWMRQNIYSASAGGTNIYGLDFDNQNNIYLGGKFRGYGEDVFIGVSVPEQNHFGFVMKTDPTATNVLWWSHHNIVTASGIGRIKFGDNVLSYTDRGGLQNFTWGDQSIDINNIGEGSEVLLAQFDKTTGDCVNLDFIQGDPGYSDNGTALTSDANGDILVGGQFQHMLYDAHGNTVINGNTTGTDFFIAKYAAGPCGEMGVKEVGETNMEIYPNPVAEKLYVQMKGKTTYRLYGPLGKLLRQGVLKKAQNSISVENLPNGLYLLELEDLEGNVEVQKVVKE